MYSCSSVPSVYDANLGKRVHIYKTEDFSLQYPKNWQVFDTTKVGNRIVQLTPSKEIFKGLRYLDYANGKIDTIRKRYKEDEPIDENLQVIDKNIDMTSTYVYINKISLNGKTLQDYLDFKLENSKKNSNLELDFKKIADNFYIVKLYDKAYNANNGYKYSSSRYKVYLKSDGQKLYELVYYTTEFRYPVYIDDANYILRSFEF